MSTERRNSAFTELASDVVVQTTNSCEEIIRDVPEPTLARIPASIYEQEADARSIFIDLNSRLERVAKTIANIPEEDKTQKLNELAASLPKNFFDIQEADMLKVLQAPTPKRLLGHF